MDSFQRHNRTAPHEPGMDNLADQLPLRACSWVACESEPATFIGTSPVPGLLPGLPLNSPPPPSKYHSSMFPASIPAVHRNCGAGGDTGVVTDRGADGAETLPAALKAETVKEYGTSAESPVI